MATDTLVTTLAQELSLRPAQVEQTVALLDAGNTLPFIARYRKEVTGSLDEEQLRQLAERLGYLRTLAERRAAILASIQEQGKLTPELVSAIETAATLQVLEDLYQPYKPKRRTRATIARERGLEPLAQLILAQPLTRDSLDTLASPYVSDDVPTPDDAWAGARDIVAEVISDDAEMRQSARQLAMERAYLGCELTDAEKDSRHVFELYYEYVEAVPRLRPHQILALNRGESEGVLKIRLDPPSDVILNRIAQKYRPDPRSPLAEQLTLATRDGWERLLAPAIERDVRRALTETAQAQAIQVFATNLKALLLQPPIRGRAVIGIDPGIRTGCKVAAVDATGKSLGTLTIYPHEPQKQWAESKRILRQIVEATSADLIAIGNGTASRETEQLVAEAIREGARAKYLIVNEAGASVYSASPLARAELPDLDVSLRGAVSIARRVLDPLAELVKIEPRSIGVGMYQHDVDDKQLTEALDAVVESAVNSVGIDLNTASPALLRYVSGIGPKLAESIVAYRDEHGAFQSRAELKKVKGLGPKAFEQCAGFLRIAGGREPLDNTAIHPESYGVVCDLFVLMGAETKRGLPAPDEVQAFRQANSLASLAGALDCGEPTLADIFDQLLRPGRDPRDDAPPPILRSDVLKLEDLKTGMRLKGTVRNVVDFGAFVDIGVKHDGLLHKSKLPRGATLEVGDVIDVTVLSVDMERERISLGWT
jgi:uncharacterized protein